MYKGAGEKMQRLADKNIAAPVNPTSLQLSTEEQITLLKKELHEVEMKILRGEGNRKKLGKEKFRLQLLLQRINPRKKMVGLSQIFMDEAMRLLPRDQWDRIMESAQHIWRCRNPQTRNDPIHEQSYIIAKKLGVEL